MNQRTSFLNLGLLRGLMVPRHVIASIGNKGEFFYQHLLKGMNDANSEIFYNMRILAKAVEEHPDQKWVVPKKYPHYFIPTVRRLYEEQKEVLDAYNKYAEEPKVEVEVAK